MTGTSLNDSARTAWLEERRSGIGGSDVAAIMGLSPWSSAFTVWAEKVNLLPLDEDDREDFEFGHMAEDMLAAYHEKRTGLAVTDRQRRAQHPVNTWAQCTLDGMVRDIPAGWDAKTTSEPPWENIPIHYQCQAQWTMYVTETERFDFTVLHMAFGRAKVRTYTLERDEDDIAKIVDRCSAFWHDNVLGGVPPEVDGSDATRDAIVACWPEPAAAVVPVDDELRNLLRNLHLAESTAATFAAEADKVRNELRLILADAEAIVDMDDVDRKGEPRRLVTFKPQTAVRLDAKRLKVEMPDVAEKYVTTTTTRVLRVNTPKEST